WRGQLWARGSDLVNATVSTAPGRASTSPAAEQFATPATGVGAALARRTATGWGVWEVGVDLRAAEGESRERFRYMAGDYTRSRVAGGRSAVGGVYLETSRQAGPWLVAGGVRLDGWSVGDARRLERDLATGGVTLDSRADDRSGAVPTARLGMRRDLGAGRAMRLAAYSGFRPPTLNELHRPFRVGNDITEANPALEPERLYGAEAGLDGEAGAWSWSATAFANRLANPVTNVTVGAGPGTFPLAGFVPAGGVLRQRMNAGRVDAVGLEAELQGRLTETLGLRASLAATRARVDGGAASPQLTGLRPAQAPGLTLTAGLDWRRSDWALTAQARFEGERFDDDLNSRVLEAGTTIDARVERRLGPVWLYLAAENLLDSNLETAESADGVESLAAPRTLRLGLRWRR
ncbi:MAG TPA: TonB-dependent receptor, partial [Caulobacteraceae bacterium]